MIRFIAVVLVLVSIGFGAYSYSKSDSHNLNAAQLEQRVVAYRANGFASASPTVTQNELKITEVDYKLMAADIELAKAKAAATGNIQCQGFRGRMQKWYAISNSSQDWKKKPLFLNAHMTRVEGGEWEYDDALLDHPSPACQSTPQEVVSHFLLSFQH